VAGFPQSEASDGVFRRKATPGVNSTVNIAGRSEEIAGVGYADSGSAARFFYTAKADSDDRIGSKHPTVKPLDLMQWLVRLVTPRGGTVLDPFGGTGTTGEAAFREGCNAVLIEREAEYQADIRRRINLMLAGPDERTVSAIKAKNLPYDAGPLFGGGSHSPVTGRQIYGEFADENGRRK
jgi:site-specific DNA-methyltransferase (adenine-specific)